MKNFKMLLSFLMMTLNFYSQNNAQAIISDLFNKNEVVKTFKCSDKEGMIISNKGLNYFFANKVSSYLSDGSDLSLFKNYATLNSDDGTLSINRNFVSKTVDERIKSLITLGVKLNAIDDFAAITSKEKLNNDIGVTGKFTFFSKGLVQFDDCNQRQSSGVTRYVTNNYAQKTIMDTERALILYKLCEEIEKKSNDFENTVEQITKEDVPHGDIKAIQNKLRTEFYLDLQKEYEKEYAALESKALDRTNSYNRMTAHWTSIETYMPITAKQYNTTPSFNENLKESKIYQWKIDLNINWIIESTSDGRFFLSLGGGLLRNSSIDTDEINKYNFIDYKNLGGIDTLHVVELEKKEIYVGSYNKFVTPTIKGKAVWFPKDWNVGASILAEQNFGIYNPLNSTLGIPIRLNDKDGEATINFEIQLRMSDLTNQIADSGPFWDKSAIGISIGLPFSSLIY